MKKTYHIFLVFTLFICLSACAQNKTNSKNNKINMTHTETITLGSGCFWCTEAIFQRLQGVVKVTSGYSGGFVDNPTYEQVCDKNTGHAEVCQIVYDTTLIKLDDILAVFWKTHDPTTLNQQGNDVGPQYRSVVFFHNEHQKELAQHYIKELNDSKAWANPVVTTVEPFQKFYAAENYHQNYYNDNKNQGYCRYVIGPKLEKFEKVFKDKLKKD
ncbi:MAG: peptide-methionine (S)-S-oxide reductase [Chitinophagaceae bacterium]|jgi:peptide-methionine (S)-S-oxide reductase|nr:MAG: peptide-methionine (S)-S-oxide reductase [Chitinophagaceae bacterium]